MRSGLLSLAVALLASVEPTCGHEIRRVRRIIEISDLAVEKRAASEKIPPKNQRQEEERILAEEEIFRQLTSHASRSGDMSMSMSMPVYSPPNESPIAPPKTDAPVTPESPAPVYPATLNPVLAPVYPATLNPVLAPVTTAPVISPGSMDPMPSTITAAPVLSPGSFAPVTETVVFPSLAPVSATTAPTPSGRDLVIQEKCGITAAQRSESIFLITSQVSSPNELRNPASPRYQAFEWIDSNDPAILCPNNDRIAQRYTMALIYYGLDGPNWINCGVDSVECSNTDPEVTRDPIRWMTGDHECVWYGLFCDDSQSVDPTLSANETAALTGIDIPDNNLGGTFPYEITKLAALKVLTLDGNYGIEGTIPSEMSNLSNLTILDMDTNKFTGNLPEALFTMTNLIAIDLNDNMLTGTLSSQIGNLLQLSVLQLENNQMSGVLPVAGLLNLEKMGTCGQNCFCGTVQLSVGSHTCILPQSY
jgi:hypothetical protein